MTTRLRDRELDRAQRAARRGLEALGRKVPDFTEPINDYSQPYRQQRERQERARLEVLDAGRSLLSAAADLEERARQAREAGVEALRHARPSVGWREVGTLLGLSGQGAHKRYRHVDDAELELTIDDELANHR